MTAPSIAGFVTRADAGLVAPRSVSYNIEPWRGGVTGHYWGPALGLANRPHADCLEVWRNGQRFHMAPGGLGTTSGAPDVAYTGAYCPHGYAFAGRGAGVRTGANGTALGNLTDYAVVYLGGAGEDPTLPALGALAWWVRELRRNGAAGTRVVPHWFHKPTGCPGPVAPHLARLNGTPIAGDRTVSHVHLEQMVLGANAVDLENGRAAARRWDAAMGLYRPDGSIEVHGGPHHGREATAGFAWLVGGAAKIRRDRQFEHGVIRLAGANRDETANAVGAALEDHPKGTIARRGRPW